MRAKKAVKAKFVAAVLALAAVAGGSGCRGRAPESTLRVSNRAYTIDRLFTDENGCTVYRFYDEGRYHYYVVDPRGAQMIGPAPKKEGAGTAGDAPEPS